MTEKTKTTRILDSIKNHRVLSIVIVAGIVLIGISTFLKSTFDIIETTEKIKNKVSAPDTASHFAHFDGMELNFAVQNFPLWGWAAGIQSILKYLGIFVSQMELAVHAKGDLDEHAFSGEYITFSLTIKKTSFPTAKEILDLIELDQPFIFGFNRKSGFFFSLLNTE